MPKIIGYIKSDPNNLDEPDLMDIVRINNGTAKVIPTSKATPKGNAKAHKKLPECHPCDVQIFDFYDGRITRPKVMIPVAGTSAYPLYDVPQGHIVKLYKPWEAVTQLRDKIIQKGREKGLQYTVTLKRNPHRQSEFLSAEYVCGKRRILITNTNPVDSAWSSKRFSCAQILTKTIVKKAVIKEDIIKWFARQHQLWQRIAYTGKYHTTNTIYGVPSILGNYQRKDNKYDYFDIHTKPLSDNGKFAGTHLITKTSVQSKMTWINPNTAISNWAFKTKKTLESKGYKGEIKYTTDPSGKIIVKGTFIKETVEHGNQCQYVLTYTQFQDKYKDSITEDWKPIRKTNVILANGTRGHAPQQVRSIAQDDNYTPDFNPIKSSEKRRVNREERKLKQLEGKVAAIKKVEQWLENERKNLT